MIQVEALAAFSDNYIWACHDGEHAVLVDPGEASSIVDWLTRRRLRPTALLLTHHHADHIGGVAELLDRWPMPVYGPEETRSAANQIVAGGDRIRVPHPALDCDVIAVPGHTLGHLAYFGHGRVFCGDTLFSCGCGRLFEGDPATMLASLDRLAALPADTQVCCAHEYTLANLAYALDVDPDNHELATWANHARELRRLDQPTLPLRLGDECRRNPFLRCRDPAFREELETRFQVRLPDAVTAFAWLRRRKDGFH
jgi:hydroxyacylglutathione hydrolase